MRKITSIYLAGPEAWYPDAANHAAAQRATCEIAGFVGLSPADLVSTSGGTEVAARELYAARTALMRRADWDKVLGIGVRSTLGTARERGTGLGLRLCKDF